MTSKRKLEEKIAETKDPVIRKQLQELLDKRERRWEHKKQGASNIVGDVFKSLNPPRTPKEEQGQRLLVLLFCVFWSIINIALAVSENDLWLLFGLFVPLVLLLMLIYN